MSRDVERLLADRGHVVERFAVGATDLELLQTADVRGAVVVTADRHFRVHTRDPARDRGRFRRAGLIRIPGEAHRATSRLADVLHLIEYLHESLRHQGDPRLIVEVRDGSVVVDSQERNAWPP